MLQAQVFTLYPDIFPGPLGKGLYGKAMSKKSDYEIEREHDFNPSTDF